MNRSLFRWHRRIGITSALFVLILAITGLLLMFSSSLNLDQKTWGGPLVKSVYNLEPKTEPVGIKVETSDGVITWVVMVDGLVYVGSADPIQLNPPLVLAVGEQEFIKFANQEEIVVTLPDGTLVERQSYSENDVENIVSFLSEDQTTIPADILDQVLERYSGRGMPVSRILLDIHTGRFFGGVGTWLMGLASILLIVLSITGIFMWTKTDQRRAKRERMKKELAALKSENN